MRTRWVMKGIEGRDTWETVGHYTPEEINTFECAKPVSPIWNDTVPDLVPGVEGTGNCTIKHTPRRLAASPIDGGE